MLDLNEKTARRIIDAVALAIDGKPASAKTFSDKPFIELSDLGAWGQQENNSINDTTRTDALSVAYLLLSGGRIPLQGIAVDGAYLRPDKWVVGALVKKGRAEEDKTTSELVLTSNGWEWIAGVLAQMGKA
jgi:hypothetical protein